MPFRIPTVLLTVSNRIFFFHFTGEDTDVGLDLSFQIRISLVPATHNLIGRYVICVVERSLLNGLRFSASM
jgi:hypothetical protein